MSKKDPKPIVIDLCKIKFTIWGIATVAFLFGLVTAGSSAISFHTETIQSGETCDEYANNCKPEYQTDYCYQGVMDKNKICDDSEFDLEPLEMLILGILLLIVNSINVYFWFKILNRKYKWWTFQYRRCKF